MQNTCSLTSDKIKVRVYTYQEYLGLMETYSRLEVTSGPDQSAEKIDFTKLNYARMRRINKSVILDDELKALLRNLSDFQCWTAITEAWCGDSAQNIPLLAKIAEESAGKINFQLVFRDDNPEFMAQYLTNGGRAIPKLIARNEYGADLFTWGPRPAGAASLIKKWKENPNGVSWNEIEVQLHQWYNDNRQQDQMKEIKALLTSH